MKARIVIVALIVVVEVVDFFLSSRGPLGGFTVVRSATIVLMQRLGNRDPTVQVYYYNPQYVVRKDTTTKDGLNKVAFCLGHKACLC